MSYRYAHTTPIDAMNTILSIDDRFRVELVDGGTTYVVELRHRRWRVDGPGLCDLADDWLAQRRTQPTWLPIVLRARRPAVWWVRSGLVLTVIQTLVRLLALGAAALSARQDGIAAGVTLLIGAWIGARVVRARLEDG